MRSLGLILVLLGCASEGLGDSGDDDSCGPSESSDADTCADLAQQELDVREAYETQQIQATARNELIAEIQKAKVKNGSTQ